jgi:hypothetical protein
MTDVEPATCSENVGREGIYYLRLSATSTNNEVK